MKKVLLAMSGGIDSAVAAFLIKQQNFDAIGATMKLVCPNFYGLNDSYEQKSMTDINDAKRVAEAINIPHKVFDFTNEFKDTVALNFAQSYENGETPNPCVVCNKKIKFGILLETAKKMGCDYIATGHYARIEEKDQRFLLKRAKDHTKDQSYFLYTLSQHQLSKTIFPLGDMTKEEARVIAEENNFVNAKKKDSQDICFVPDGEYVKVIENITQKSYPQGVFMSKDNSVLGTHGGIVKYTVGQRKGLGISLSKPVYVLKKDAQKNIVVLGDNEDLYQDSCYVKNVNWIYYENPPKTIDATVKIRFNQKEQPATIIVIDQNRVKINFSAPQRAISKGQSAVFYNGEYVLGGGIIE